MKRCDFCDAPIATRRADAKYCSGACRVGAHRRNKASAGLPQQMVQARRWIRRSARKHPLSAHTGKGVSIHDAGEFADYATAAASTAGVGLGFVLGDGIGCIDLDHCLIDGAPTEAAARFLLGYQNHYIEISPSGDGLHIWGTAQAGRGSRRTVDGLQIETYSQGRYITVTGNVFQPGALAIL